MPKRRQKVKRYHRSFYSRGDKIKKAIGIVVLAVGGAGCSLAGSPLCAGLGHHTGIRWCGTETCPLRRRPLLRHPPRRRPLPKPPLPRLPSSEAASSRPEPVAGTVIREGSWSAVSLSALGDEASIRSTAQSLAAQGVTYAVIPLKDTSGYVYYASAVPAASGSVAATVVDPP